MYRLLNAVLSVESTKDETQQSSVVERISGERH